MENSNAVCVEPDSSLEQTVDENGKIDVYESKDTQETNDLDSKIRFKMPTMPTFTKPKVAKPVVSKKTNPTKDKHITEMNDGTCLHTELNENTNHTDVSPETKISDHKNVKVSKLSPAEVLKQARIAIPYKEPSWGGMCDDDYSFEVIKNGAIIDKVKLDKSFIVFGRLPSCDVTMEHPSLSRHHAVVQFCKTPGDTCKQEKGWYLYDLDSTHGTWINKNKVFAKKYYRIRVGHVLKFGGSTRLHILQGPEEDAEEESDLSVEEMKEQREKQKREAEFLRQAELAENERQIQEMKAKEEARGCSWGMGDDAEADEEENPFADIINTENEELYIDDPKKALKGFFEREGYEEPEYDVEESGRGKYRCTVELPVDTPTGQAMVAEATISGKKREAIVQCALEACRILDRQGLLRAATHESRKRKKKNWEDDDFYDSDDDTFLDRTGDIERKRRQRMQKAGKLDNKAETYDSLMEKLNAVRKDIADIEKKLAEAKAEAEAMQDDSMDALDAYMSAIKSGAMDTKTRMKLKRQLLGLQQEEQKLHKLTNVAKPASLPEFKGFSKVAQVKANTGKALPSFGRLRKQVEKPKPQRTEFQSVGNDIVEEDEEEDVTMETVVKDKHLSDISSSTSCECDINDINNKSGSKSPTEMQETTMNDQSSVSECDSKQRTAGPCIEGLAIFPPDVDTELGKKDICHSSQDNIQASKKNKGKIAVEKVKRNEPDLKHGKTYGYEDPDYAVWLPPENQSGDGKTHLNEKFGY